MPSIITVPSTVIAVEQTIGQSRFDTNFSGGSTGDSETAVYGPPRWKSNITSDEDLTQRKMAPWIQMLLAMEGKINRLAMFDFLKTEPEGTMRGSMVTTSAVAAGAKSMSITASGQAAKTLLMGDWLGFNQTGNNRQVVAISGDATANGSGVIVVNFQPYLRVALPAGAVVTWDRPTWLAMLTSDGADWRNRGSNQGGMSLEFVESWLP